VIYLDTSVALAYLLSEERTPPESLWRETLMSSRLLEYELWVRINAYGLAKSHGEALRQLVARVAFVELAPEVLHRALEPFPKVVRTLDSLHLASLDFLRKRGQKVELASYDARQLDAARALGIPISPLVAA
jgi:predicted nucleic acid-binding protein